MQAIEYKPATTTVPPIRKDDSLHYVPRNGQIVHLPWSVLTDTERESLLQANDRAYYNVNFDIYSY